MEIARPAATRLSIVADRQAAHRFKHEEFRASLAIHSMSSYVAAAKISEIPDPGSLLVEVEQRLVVLIRAAGHFYALDDVCTHDGGPLSDGPVDALEASIACPRHGAKFDIKSGAAVTMPATRATVSHEVKIEGDQVFVRLVDG